MVSVILVVAMAVVWRNAAAMTVPAKEGTEVKSFPEQGYFILMEF